MAVTPTGEGARVTMAARIGRGGGAAGGLRSPVLSACHPPPHPPPCMVRIRLAALAALLLSGAGAYLAYGDPPASPSAALAASLLPTPPPSGPDASAPRRVPPLVDAPTFPTPLWLDAPYAALDVAPGAQVAREDAPLPPVFDRAAFDALGLGAWISLHQLRADLQRALGGAHRLRLLADAEAELLHPYRLPVLDTLAARAATATRYGGLHLGRGDTLRGAGTLLVEGDLAVTEGGALYWSGLVLLRTDRGPHQLRADLHGDVAIQGALAVQQRAREPFAWQSALARDVAPGVYVSLGERALIYYDAPSLRAALDALLPPDGTDPAG